MNRNISSVFRCLNELKPDAFAVINGNTSYPELNGYAIFYKAPSTGVYIQIEIFNLPDGFFGTHIHEFGNCTIPFDKTGNHYNPTASIHPFHSGDLPPMLSTSGYAWTFFYDGRLSIDELIDKSIIIHSDRDDFTSQPSGNSGAKIGCGVIKKYN